MRAVQIASDRRVSLVDTPAPQRRPDEVILRPLACGLCGTDLHLWRGRHPGARYPVIPGHEIAAQVIAVGVEAQGLREGDRVAVNPNVTCGACSWCRRGQPHQCDDLRSLGIALPGAAAEEMAAPWRKVHVVPSRLSDATTALIEPLACALHALESAHMVRGRRVLVFGGGTMGLLTALACRHYAAAEVTVVEPFAAKRAVAIDLDLTRVCDPLALGDDDRHEVVFEAAGTRAALHQALRHVHKTGTLVQVGQHHARATIPVRPYALYARELHLVGSNSLANCFGAAIDLMSDLAPEIERLVGVWFPVWDCGRALAHMAEGQSVKTMLRYG